MNTGGPASEKTLLDEFAGQALAGFFGYISETQAYLKDAGHDGIKRDQVAKECYEQAQAMLAEKARREAVVEDSSTTDHSPDAGKMAALEAENKAAQSEVKRLLVELHKFADSHAKLESANRELVEAFGRFVDYVSRVNGVAVFQEPLFAEMRAILAKHKATK